MPSLLLGCPFLYRQNTAPGEMLLSPIIFIGWLEGLYEKKIKRPFGGA
jgi:hypothetical protein